MPPHPASRAPIIPDYQSPSVSADGRVTLRYHHPAARAVWCEAEWNAGAPADLRRTPSGLWEITSPPLTPEIYEYALFADGARVIDYQNPAVKNRFTSLVRVPGPEPGLYDVRPVPQGALHLHRYWSSVSASHRRLHLYTPPGYEQATALSYPILYLLHGAGDDDSGWAVSGCVQAIADNLIAQNRAAPMVIAMPHGHLLGPIWKENRAEKIAAFCTDLHHCVIPFVETLYRIRRAPEHRAIAGLSMGGGQTLCAGLPHRELFHSFGIFSAGLWPEVEPWLRPALPALAAHPPRLLWVGIGRSDFLFPHCTRLRQALAAAGVPFIYHEDATSHSWQAWRAYLARFLPLLFSAS